MRNGVFCCNRPGLSRNDAEKHCNIDVATMCNAMRLVVVCRPGKGAICATLRHGLLAHEKPGTARVLGCCATFHVIWESGGCPICVNRGARVKKDRKYGRFVYQLGV